MGEKRNACWVLKETEYVEQLGIVGRVILRWILKRVGGLDLIYLAEYRDNWQGLVTTVMKLLVP
jgi:hypothetical protein